MDPVELGRQKYLAVYDYGTGSVLRHVWAKSPDEITAKYPELRVIPKDKESEALAGFMGVLRESDCDAPDDFLNARG